MVKIGCVSLDVSHPLRFASFMKDFCMDMKYEYVCKESFRSESSADFFVRKCGLAGKVEKIEDMVDKVDIGFIHSCNWEKHLDAAMPFIEKGKPVFIDKPIVGNMKDVKKLRELVANGAKIYGSSAARHSKEVREFFAMPEEERGQILSIFGTCGVDEFNYGVHIVEAFAKIAGAKAVSCKFVGKSTVNEKTPCEVYSIEYENGIIATYHLVKDVYHPFDISIMTTTRTYSFSMDIDAIYLNLMREIYGQMTRGESDLADIETLINCTEIMLCGKKSRDELNGAKVTLDELTENDGFDGYAFEEFYASTAGDIYKD